MSEKLSFWQALFFKALPRFYSSSPGLTAYRIHGDCLRPFLLPDDMVMVDTSLDPCDGELVLVNMRFKRALSVTGCVSVGGGVTYQYKHALKQLVTIDDVPHLACATGAVRADGHEILGVVVATRRRGWRRAPMSPITFPITMPAPAPERRSPVDARIATPV